MKIIDVGSGPPLVIVPGIQGRWEWMKPTVAALSRSCRVLTFSYADEPTCGGDFDPANGFTSYVEQVRAAMDQAGIERAAICGVSYGGLVAAAFCARHPDRVSSAVFVSALPPSWQPNARARFYLRAPRLLSPLFFLASLRLYREIAAASEGRLAGAAAALRHAVNVLQHMLSPSRMARRVHLLETEQLADEVRTVAVPTLVITGEPALDRVVPVRQTEEYVRLCACCERVTIDRTGHLGLITRPDRFAAAVVPFVRRTAGSEAGSGADGRRRVG